MLVIICIGIGALKILAALVKAVWARFAARRQVAREGAEASSAKADSMPSTARKAFASIIGMLKSMAMGAGGGWMAGALLGTLLAATAREDIVTRALGMGMHGGILGGIGAGIGALIGDDKTARAAWCGAVGGALLGAVGGEALGAEAWIAKSIAAIDSWDIRLSLRNVVSNVGGAGASAGAIAGIFTMVAIDTFRGWEAARRAGWCALSLACLGVLAGEVTGGNIFTGAALGGFIGAVLGALFPERARGNQQNSQASAGAAPREKSPSSGAVIRDLPQLRDAERVDD